MGVNANGFLQPVISLVNSDHLAESCDEVS